MTKSPFLKKKPRYFTLIDLEKFSILNPKLTRKDGSRIKYMYIALAMSENFTITFNA